MEVAAAAVEVVVDAGERKNGVVNGAVEILGAAGKTRMKNDTTSRQENGSGLTEMVAAGKNRMEITSDGRTDVREKNAGITETAITTATKETVGFGPVVVLTVVAAGAGHRASAISGAAEAAGETAQ